MQRLEHHVLMSADTVGGVWTYALDLAAALAEYDVSVTLAAMGGEPSEAQRARAAEISTLDVRARDYKLEWMEAPWTDLEEAGAWLEELAEEVEPDVVHLNHYAHGHLDWGAPTVVVGHSCVTSWFEAVHGEAPLGSRDRYRRVVRRGLAGADLVAAPSEWMLRQLENHYGPLPADSLSRAIWNGRRAGLFETARESCDGEEPFVLSAGRLWDEAKNVALLEAAGDQITWPIEVAGPTQHPDGGAVDPTGVDLLGVLSSPELAEKYASAPIYALPARYEPFGLTALEAALSGCALVLGDIPTLREIWGEAALFVDPDDADALVNAVESLIDDRTRRDAYRRRARERARHLTAERMAERYLDAYRTLGACSTTSASPSSDDGAASPPDVDVVSRSSHGASTEGDA